MDLSQVIVSLLINGLVTGGMYSIIGVGMNLSLGVMRIFNVAHGELMILGAYITFWLFTLFNLDPIVSLLASMPILFFFGMAIQATLGNSLIKRIDPSVITPISLLVFFGMAMVIRNTTLQMWTADYRGLTYLTSPVSILSISVSTVRLVVFAVSILMAVFVQLFLGRTYTGKALQAIAQDKVAAVLMGVNVNRLNAICFGVAAALAGAAGSLLGMLFVFNPFSGFEYTSRALAVIVLGGLGSVAGALLGGLLLGVSESFISYFVSSAYGRALDYVVILLVVLIKPTGIRGKQQSEP